VFTAGPGWRHVCSPRVERVGGPGHVRRDAPAVPLLSAAATTDAAATVPPPQPTTAAAEAATDDLPAAGQAGTMWFHQLLQ